MKQYIVDAFTDHVFSGNPAAVCVMKHWLGDDLLQSIAKENNLSETAFAVKEGGSYHLRWFTPGGEIDLCGHATLATSFVILSFYEKGSRKVDFNTKSGILTVVRNDDMYEMTFPAYTLKETAVTDAMAEAFGVRPIEAWMGRDLLCVFEDEFVVRHMKPDFKKLMALDGLLQHATAKGKGFDCVSRSFAPKLLVSEDPVCGSGHCHIVPYWSKVTGKDHLTAYQASARGGILYCRTDGEHVFLSGKAVLFAVSELMID